MDDSYDVEKSADDDKDDATLYIDCIRLVEGGHLQRFRNLAAKFDIIRYELNDGPALTGDGSTIGKKYTIMVPTSSSPTAELIQKTLSAHEYARELQREYIADLIGHRANLPPYQQRFFRVLQLNDVRRCNAFIQHLLNRKREHDFAVQGLFYSAQLGSVRLLDYFLTRWKIDINTEEEQENGYTRTALLTAITYQQNEAAKYLLFRDADPSIKGQYDNALVTALHYQSKTDLLRLLLEKNVDLTARHPDYPHLTLREYCVLTNRVQAKSELDAYIIRLISQGNYQRLKWLVDRGYTYINVKISTKRNGKQLAKERYYGKIVKLIDDVEQTQAKARIKMNY